ncbi:MAG: alcohol dehydrogenase catalytic domain-containing protein [Nitrospirales bacterium]
MHGLHFHQTLQYRTDLPLAPLPQHEARIDVLLAGICSTDLHILQGYMGFSGILGHEFVGKVTESPDDPFWVGKRVVGEINASCRICPTCLKGRSSHCPHRTVLGIQGRDGVFAESVTLPTANLRVVPQTLTDDQAVFVEPLAAACEVTQQMHVEPTEKIVVLGDGKLGLLCAQVLALQGCAVQVLGKHPEHAEWLAERGISFVTTPVDISKQADLVVEATGSPAGFDLALQLLRPRGRLILKSTYHGTLAIRMADIVIHEISIIGSRCGPFEPSLRLLDNHLIDVKPFIHARYPLSQGIRAMERAAQGGTLKVLLHPD